MNRQKEWVIGLLATLALLAALADAQAATLAEVDQNYSLVDLTACKMPGGRIAPMQSESYESYNHQRRYMDLDGDGICEAMDFWIERLADQASPGMRTLEHRFKRYKNGKWVTFEADMDFYPYAIRIKSGGELVFVQAATENDIGDNMAALAFGAPKVVRPKGWVVSAGSADILELSPYVGRPGPILQALAVLLMQRLQRNELPRGELAVMASPLRAELERKKIRWLLQEAKKTLDVSERVPLDANGLPVGLTDEGSVGKLN